MVISKNNYSFDDSNLLRISFWHTTEAFCYCSESSGRYLTISTILHDGHCDSTVYYAEWTVSQTEGNFRVGWEALIFLFPSLLPPYDSFTSVTFLDVHTSWEMVMSAELQVTMSAMGNDVVNTPSRSYRTRETVFKLINKHNILLWICPVNKFF